MNRIEEIKKEIKETEVIDVYKDLSEESLITKIQVFDILDKYDNQPDYVKVQNGKECYCTERYRDEQFRKAFKEFKNIFDKKNINDENIYNEYSFEQLIEYGQYYIKELEQKYNLGGE